MKERLCGIFIIFYREIKCGLKDINDICFIKHSDKNRLPHSYFEPTSRPGSEN